MIFLENRCWITLLRGTPLFPRQGSEDNCEDIFYFRPHFLFVRTSLLETCWSQIPTKRPSAAEVVELLSCHPRLLSPCIDVPMASVQVRGVRLLQTHTLIGQEIQLSNSCPIRLRRKLLSNNHLPQVERTDSLEMITQRLGGGIQVIMVQKVLMSLVTEVILCF